MTNGNGTSGPAVLVVEDDASVLNIIRDYLARAGFRVQTAGNGWEATKRLKEGTFDLIISEMSVSDMDGCSLREKCVVNPTTRDIPFLFLAPEKALDPQVRALRMGVDDIITKPFDPIVLVARVQAVLQRRRSYEEMVRVDPLTRMLNRPTLEKELSDEMHRIRRYGRHGSLVLIDVDDFNAVKKESGVGMGDLLLTCLAGVILTNVRSVDVTGRFHGEQFLLFLPETNIDGAKTLAVRMQKQLAAIADAVAAYPLGFTCAMISVPEHGDEMGEVIPRIEGAMRHAKKSDKGSVVVWSPSIAPELVAAE